MSQATVTADILGTPSGRAIATPKGRRGNYAIVLVAAIAGALVALGANAGLNAYQAGVTADQATRANAAQVQFLLSERNEAPVGINDNGRSVVQHSANERAEAPISGDVLSGVPAFLQSERNEAPAGH